MALICLTPNVIETRQMLRRKIIETRGHFPNDDAAIKGWEIGRTFSSECDPRCCSALHSSRGNTPPERRTARVDTLGDFS
jgi:hypothetical protein